MLVGKPEFVFNPKSRCPVTLLLVSSESIKWSTHPRKEKVAVAKVMKSVRQQRVVGTLYLVDSSTASKPSSNQVGEKLISMRLLSNKCVS
jgi:hypothetical protein